MQKIILVFFTVILSSLIFAQTMPPSFPTEATDVTALQIQEFIDNLPRDRVSDRPIRVVETTGDMRLGVFGVYRPMGVTGDVNVHLVDTTEIYYICG